MKTKLNNLIRYFRIKAFLYTVLLDFQSFCVWNISSIGHNTCDVIWVKPIINVTVLGRIVLAFWFCYFHFSEEVQGQVQTVPSSTR